MSTDRPDPHIVRNRPSAAAAAAAAAAPVAKEIDDDEFFLFMESLVTAIALHPHTPPTLTLTLTSLSRFRSPRCAGSVGEEEAVLLGRAVRPRAPPFGFILFINVFDTLHRSVLF